MDQRDAELLRDDRVGDVDGLAVERQRAAASGDRRRRGSWRRSICRRRSRRAARGFRRAAGRDRRRAAPRRRRTAWRCRGPRSAASPPGRLPHRSWSASRRYRGIGVDQLLRLEIGPERRRDRRCRAPATFCVDLARPRGAGNDRNDDRVGKDELQRGGGQGARRAPCTPPRCRAPCAWISGEALP